MPANRVVAVSGQLILISGLGSVIGPLVGTSLMARFGINGLLYFMAIAAFLLALVAVCGSLIIAAPLHVPRSFDILAPQAAPLAHDSLGPCEDLGSDAIGNT
jgi:MFS family permease